MRYTKLEGIILKKQNYKEADQILTLWTKEAGKIRCLVKGIRLAKSKLSYSLLDLSLVAVEITGRHFPTLISAKCQKHHKNLSNDLKKTAMAFYGMELVLKLTADEHPNTRVFELLVDFLEQLESHTPATGHGIVDEFALSLVESLGFGLPTKADSHTDVNHFIETLIERNLKSEAFLIAT